MELRKKIVVLALGCVLGMTGFNVFASFIVLGKDGNYYECWHEVVEEGTPGEHTVTICALADHMPPVEP